MPEFDLLNPAELIAETYRRQISHTIDAYSVSHVVVGEALQNAMDAIAVDKPKEGGLITISMNFDNSEVSVLDNGIGFPPEPKLLVLGGSRKQGVKSVAGLVGVGIKVTMFSSCQFTIKSRTQGSSWRIVVDDADRFADQSQLSLPIPHPFPDDHEPLPHKGTLVIAKFRKPSDPENWKMRQFLDLVISNTVQPDLGTDGGFLKTIRSAPSSINRACYLLASYLCRFTYAGDTLRPLGGRDGLENAKIRIVLRCSNPGETLGDPWGELWGEDPEISYEFTPRYLRVDETVKLTKAMRPPIFDDAIGKGGTALDITHRGFNVLEYIDNEGYEKLLQNRNGQLPKNIDRFREQLFPKINCIYLAIGRIPSFHDYLPGGSRRVLAANGVVTDHELNIISGQNQQYVRCIDLVIDVDAELNYGKTHITNMHLVGLTRDFLNEAYRRTLQTASSRFVGKVLQDDDNDKEDIFFDRVPLGIPGFINVRTPRDENDVISLFAELTARGVLQSYVIFGFSQSDPYDSRMVIRRECDRADLLDDPKRDELKVVEFKLIAASIVRDFESEQKDPKEVDLIIAWDEGDITSSARFSFEDIQHSKAHKASPQRVFPNVGRFLSDNKRAIEVQVLFLKNVISKLTGDASN